MIFSNDKAIYIQMADRLCDEILAGKYADDDRIPSVREYAVMLQVNTNTAVKPTTSWLAMASSTTSEVWAISSRLVQHERLRNLAKKSL